MRGHSVARFLLALAILATSACTAGDKPELDATSQRFPITSLLDTDSSQPSCPVTEHRDPPRLLDITAYGLEGPLWWNPGQAYKVNWQVENPTREENNYAPIGVRLRLYGSERDEYALELTPRPSLVSFPGAGCWTLTVERADERAETTLFIRQDIPRALVLSDRDSVPPNPDEATVDPVLSDLAPLLQVLEQAEWRPAPDDLQGIRLNLLWESGWRQPMLYTPSRNGEGPLLVVQKSFLIGRCDEAGYVAVPLPDSLATTIGQKAQDWPETIVRDLPQFASSCMTFLPAN